VQALTVPLVADDRIGRAVLPELTRLDRHIVDADELTRLADKFGGVGGTGRWSTSVPSAACGGARSPASRCGTSTCLQGPSPWPRRWCVADVARWAAGLGRMVKDENTGKTKYEGLGFHDLRRANATGLVAAGVDVKTAQGLLGQSDARLTLDHYAQVVTELGALAAEAGKRLIKTAARDNRALEARSGATGTRPRTRREGL
jgi:hypothetical protein